MKMIWFGMMAAPRSKQFDDVYFSAEDGLAETRHVFLAGNDLPHAWAGRDRFVIGETGFGTGLNFLAVAKLFEETAAAGQKLHFISVEKYPLSRDDIVAAIGPWGDALSPQAAALCKLYPKEGIPTGRSFFQVADQVSLELHIGDANDVMADWDASVDAWFLDGFKPASNPDMWSGTVFAQMARLSRSGTTFATFTAAGFVRRGLVDVGFDVRKVPGFGRKREMSVGVFS